MNRINPLAGLIGYGDSDDSDDGAPSPTKVPHPHMAMSNASYPELPLHPPGVHPAPISHCPWSACYDENSGYTYYWNHQTNAVTWEAPPEYLLALRVAQQQLQTQGFPGTAQEVSAEEWQMYQQALADKQSGLGKLGPRPSPKPMKLHPKPPVENKNNPKKRRHSEDVEEKIELITSYHNSDSESNDEPESPQKNTAPPPSAKVSKTAKKSKPKPPASAYGPALPSNQNYSAPIGPEMPSNVQKAKSPKSPRNKVLNAATRIQEKPTVIEDSEDSQDENALLNKLKDKAQLLARLGGEIPSELHKIIYDDNRSPNKSQKTKDSMQMIDNIDELLNEIEKKELPKLKSKKGDKANDADTKSKDIQATSPKSREISPPSEVKPLFPSIMNIPENDSNMPTDNENRKNNDKNEVINSVDKRGANLYLMNADNYTENTQRKKLRISNSVLPERKRNMSPVYTTKYAQSNDGFNNERTGLGFSKDDQGDDSPKNTMLGNTISYGNGLTFTKGETLNEEKRDEDLDELTELVEAKLKYLNQLQPCAITPLQEMLIQMQTLAGAFRAGALAARWWRRRAQGAARALQLHEAGAAPPGWTLAFQRSEGKYQYRRESDGLVQWEYPAVADTDMDISTTPPHPGIEGKEELPPLPCSPVRSAAGPPPPPPPPPPPAPAWRAHTPPPPTWSDPPPPGCDDPPPLPIDGKREIGDELMSFYNDIAELEKQSSEPPTTCNTPEPPPPPVIENKENEREEEKEQEKEELLEKEREREKRKEREKLKEKEARDKREKEAKVNKKKSKVKISTSMGLKHKSVSSLVAKWQQVADEINSD